MKEFRDILGAYYREEITEAQAEVKLAALGSGTLAEFVRDAFDRGWISKFNIGLNEDGDPT